VISAYLPGRPRPATSPVSARICDWDRMDAGAGTGILSFMFGEHKPSASQHTDRLDRAVVRLGERGVPILLVRGARSELVAPEAVDYFMTLAPHTRHVRCGRGRAHGRRRSQRQVQ